MINTYLEQLVAIAQKERRIILGLMSGTSLDGLDLALCAFTGYGNSTKVEVLHHTTIPYPTSVIEQLKTVCSQPTVSLAQVCLLNAGLGQLHGQWVNQQLSKWGISPDTVDCIASHGQTIYHAPKRLHQQEEFGNATLQMVDGDHIAVETGIITIADFRQKHVAMGGEGAPLAQYGDWLLFRKKGEHRILLNIGGIANFTWLPAVGGVGDMLSTDTGPGNTLIDAYVQKHFPPLRYDENGSIAASGTVNEKLLAELLNDRFFQAALPKTTGQELLNPQYVENAIVATQVMVTPKDLIATLTAFTTHSIVRAIRQANRYQAKEIVVFTSGGGVHNNTLLQHIQSLLPEARFQSLNTLGIHPDAKEAVLFALLANELFAPKTSEEAVLPVRLGKICLPA